LEEIAVNHHVVIGAGPVGSGIATRLAERGTPVTVVTRSGSGPAHPLVSRLRLDATDGEGLSRVADGAAAIYNCVNPEYHRWPVDWPPMHQAFMTAAEKTGAVLVMTDNLYVFGRGTPMPMAEQSPVTATGTKGGVRAGMARDLLQGHADGRFRATLARASDFYGPTVLGAALGERVVPKLIAGKRVSVLGSPDVPHSLSYMPDVVETLVTIADDERAWGKAWHVPNAPAVSQRETINALVKAAGTTAKVSAVPKVALNSLAVFVPLMRELKETWHQWAAPWITDSTLTEQTFGLSATPLDEAAAATIAWWRLRSGNG
jgi:nucleoside-diphosphate-sugar epimerase